MATYRTATKPTDTTTMLRADDAVERPVVDVSNKIDLINPKATPFLQLVKLLGTETCHNMKFEWLSDELMPHWDTLDGTVQIAAATLDVDSGEMWQVWDVGYIPSTAGVFRVDSISTDQLTITWVKAQTAAAADEANVLNTASSYEAGADFKQPRSIKETHDYNYCQIIRHTVGATEIQRATKMYGGPDFPYQKRKKAEEFKLKEEFALLWSERSHGTGGTHPHWTTRGWRNFVTTNVRNQADVALTRAALNTHIRVMADSGDESATTWLALCSRLGLQIVTQLATSIERIDTGKEKALLGIAVFRYIGPNGVLNLVVHPEFSKDSSTLTNQMFLMDLNPRRMKVRRMPVDIGMGTQVGTQLRMNVQDPGETVRIDELYNIIGLQLGHEETQGVIYNLSQ